MRRRCLALVLSLTRYRKVIITPAEILGLMVPCKTLEPVDTLFLTCMFIRSLLPSTGENVLSKLVIRDLTAIFSGVCQDFGAELKECGGEDDHVHLMVIYPPKVPVSKLVNSLKGVSSRLLREHRPEISGRYKDGALRSASYFAGSCGGAPPSVIAEYVRNNEGPRLLPALNGGVSVARAKMILCGSTSVGLVPLWLRPSPTPPSCCRGRAPGLCGGRAH